MTNRVLFERHWAINGDKQDPGAKYEAGFVSEKPEHSHLNWLQSQEEDFYQSLAEDGIFHQSNSMGLQYLEGSIASFEEGGVVKIKIRKGSSYLASFGGLSEVEAERQLAAFNSTMDSHFTDKTDPHEVSPSQANTYTYNESDLRVQVITDDANRHEARKDNPHNVTYDQIGTLPTSGGDFTGQVDFEAKGTILSNNRMIHADEDLYLGDVHGVGFGISETDEPVVWKDHKRYTIFTEDNYLEVRNRFEPRYALPPEDVSIPFSNNLTAWKGCVGGVTTSWDNNIFERGKGLKIAGTVSFDGDDFLGLSSTMTVSLSGSVVLTLGSTKITTNGSTVVVADSGKSINTAYTSGTIVVVRTTSELKLFVDGVLKAHQTGALGGMTTACTITGTGNVKDLRIWADALTHEQVTKI